MLQDQQLVPSSSEPTYNAVDDISMAGSNGSPLVEYPEDRLGPSQDASRRLFYMYAPMIYWHTMSSVVEDELACRLIEQLADEAYRLANKQRSTNIGC